jgi:hypothetical protein
VSLLTLYFASSFFHFHFKHHLTLALLLTADTNVQDFTHGAENKVGVVFENATCSISIGTFTVNPTLKLDDRAGVAVNDNDGVRLLSVGSKHADMITLEVPDTINRLGDATHTAIVNWLGMVDGDSARKPGPRLKGDDDEIDLDGQNLVTNPDFEQVGVDGKPVGWSIKSTDHSFSRSTAVTQAPATASLEYKSECRCVPTLHLL